MPQVRVLKLDANLGEERFVRDNRLLGPPQNPWHEGNLHYSHAERSDPRLAQKRGEPGAPGCEQILLTAGIGIACQKACSRQQPAAQSAVYLTKWITLLLPDPCSVSGVAAIRINSD